MPVLSIADGSAVAEGSGAKATFTITSVVDVTERLRVRYLPDDGIGNFLIGDIAESDQIAFLDFNGGKTATLTLDIADDEVAEEAGIVTVTLLADDASPINYSVVASGSTGSVAVTDDDMLALLQWLRLLQNLNQQVLQLQHSMLLFQLHRLAI